MTDHSVHAPCPLDVRKVLGPFYKTVDVMKSARNTSNHMMCVWADDMKAIEDVMLFLESLRDSQSVTSNDVAPCPPDPFELCVMIVEEECWLDMPESAFHRPIGHSIRNRIRCAQRDQRLASAQSAPCPQCSRLQAYIAQAVASFEKYPADTDFQEGYRTALIVIRDDAFTSPETCICGVPGCSRIPPNAGVAQQASCPCGIGDEPCPGPDGQPLCAVADAMATLKSVARSAVASHSQKSPDPHCPEATNDHD